MNKGELKSKLRFLVMHYNPELVITDSAWDKAFHFYEGYQSCFDAIVKFPVGDSYAQNFILDETLKYLIKCTQ